MSTLAPELIKTKLASLDSTQESIVAVSSWLLFHRRNAPQIVDTWFTAVQEGSANRKLNLIYLANEVSQQSRAKKRPEYPSAFSPVLPDAVEHVFRHSTSEVQGKLTRVVDVWKQRSVFPSEVLNNVSKRLEAKPKVPNGAGQANMNVPHDLTSINMAYAKVVGAATSSSLALGTANSLYSNLIEADQSTRLSPDLHAARLKQLSKALETAHESVQAAMQLREDIVKKLQALEQINFTALESEQNALTEIAKKAKVVDRKSQDVDRTLKDLSRTTRSTTPEMERPAIEALTPPLPPLEIPSFEMPTLDANMRTTTPDDIVARLQMQVDQSLSEREEGLSSSAPDQQDIGTSPGPGVLTSAAGESSDPMQQDDVGDTNDNSAIGRVEAGEEEEEYVP